MGNFGAEIRSTRIGLLLFCIKSNLMSSDNAQPLLLSMLLYCDLVRLGYALLSQVYTNSGILSIRLPISYRVLLCILCEN